MICMRWGEKYPADYVRVLKSAVAKHLKRRHRFVCLTDDPDALASDGIETFPLPDIPTGSRERGWHKIALFKPQLYDLVGEALFLDLDLVVLGDLSVFFDAAGEFLIIREWPVLGMRLGLVSYRGGNSSVFRFRIGGQAGVYRAFMEDSVGAMGLFRNEQRFLSAHAEGLAFWRDGLCASFKRDCMGFFPSHFFVSPSAPRGSRIVVFHGSPSPHELLGGGFWGRRLYRGYGCVSWVRDYWLAHGGGGEPPQASFS